MYVRNDGVAKETKESIVGRREAGRRRRESSTARDWKNVLWQDGARQATKMIWLYGRPAGAILPVTSQ